MPLRMGVRSVGALGLADCDLSRESLEAIGSLVAISIERANTFEKLTRTEAARETDRLRSVLLDSVTHEFRTPLTAINGSLEGLMDGVLPPNDGTYQRIYQEADRLQRLVDLEYTSVEITLHERGGHIKPSEVLVDPDRAIQICRDTQRLTPVAYSVEIEAPEDSYYAQFAACCKLAKATKVVTISVASAELGTPFNAEVERLGDRNALAVNRLKQMEAALDTVPRPDLQASYTAVLDVQKRMLLMRGQLEKLQSDQQRISRYVTAQRQIVDSLQQISSGPGAAGLGAEGGDGGNSKSTIVRIIAAQEQERQRLVRQLHDGPAQSLTNLILQAEICERVFDIDAKRARAELVDLKTAVSATFQKVRDYMFDLRPMMLDDLGLVPTLRRYVDNFNEKSGVPAVLTMTGNERRFAAYKEVVIFRVVQELLGNVRQHAHATRVTILLDVTDDQARIVVEDNGSGFNVDEMLNTPQPKGIGLSTMRERVAMLGGHLQVDSTIGRGTQVTLEILREGFDAPQKMALVRQFCFEHGLLGTNTKSVDDVGIKYPDGSVRDMVVLSESGPLFGRACRDRGQKRVPEPPASSLASGCSARRPSSKWLVQVGQKLVSREPSGKTRATLARG